MDDDPRHGSRPDPDLHVVFEVLNEIGIVAQLSRAAFERRLPDGLTVPHFSVINHLTRLGDGRTPLQIARAFQSPKASMTNTLSGLERRGLVTVRPNPRDGRGKLVFLTDAGRTFRETAIASLRPDMAALAASVGLDAIAALAAPLSAMRQALDAAREA